ncbi:hypothetical protein DMH04_09660 [Kibdelosporangium aridum]|uniref:Uncharacterized protein n=1 Tax=Kibdelosporangium aridum TaxID=2030 RepID=A0A428ZIU5_KIBAR|nr:DMT family transporter [Kibdelosporangium aridum]RSM87974.1 hypothetical protein DMH04_09660 [Kibdelosporangium aridum]
MTALAIMFAVISACCTAIGVHLQHQGVRDEAEASQRGPRVARRVLRNRQWLLGFGTLFTCAVLQTVALALAPVTIVAPIVVLALPATAILNAHTSRKRLDRVATTAVIASAGGIAVFVALASRTATAVAFSPSSVLLACQIIAGTIVLLGVSAALRRGIVRCVLLASGAGAGYGLLSILARDVMYTVQIGGWADVAPVSVIGLVVAFAVGSWFIQLAYASGPPDVVVGCHTVLNPLVASGIAIWLLGEAPAASTWTAVGMVCAGLVAIGGVVQLTRHHPQVRRAATQA